ncbi:hypothetical protein WMF38_57225 [Sorangium sp. So ce118]
MIRPNTSAPIVLDAADSSNDPVTGVTDLVVTIVDVDSESATFGQVWDWSTDAFAATPVQPTTALDEVNATYAPGKYAVTWPGTVAGHYVATVTQTTATTVANVPASVELQVRADAAPGDQMALTSGERTSAAAAVWASAESSTVGTNGYAVSLMRKWITNSTQVDTTSSGRMRLFDDDGQTALLTWTLRDANGNAITTPAGSPARRGEAS